MLKRKKTTASDELVVVKSVRRTRSRRMKFCVQRGLGGMPSTSSAREPWLSWGIACQFYRKFLITSFFPLSINTNPTADLYQILLTPNLYSSLSLSEKLYPQDGGGGRHRGIESP